MNVNPRAQRPGRAKERIYSPELLKEMMKKASNVAAEGTQRMIKLEKTYQLKG